MKRLISLLLLLVLGLSLCSCDNLAPILESLKANFETTALNGTTTEDFTPDETTPDETTPEGTTPGGTTTEGTTQGEPSDPNPPAANTPIHPDYVTTQMLEETTYSYTFSVSIDSSNANVYISLGDFFNYVLAPYLNVSIQFEQTLDSTDWFVNKNSANSSTRIFDGDTVTFAAKDIPPEPPVGDGEEDNETDDGKITIFFYHTMGQSLQAILDEYIEEFNKLYPNITVVHEQIGSYDDVHEQIKQDILIGDQPNIAYCYPEHVSLYNVAYAVKTLDDFINSIDTVTRADGTVEQIGLTQEQRDNFIDGFYNEGNIYGDGLMYTMPMSKSTEVLYYNKTFFEKHNLQVPTTWEEMEAVCAQIKAIEGDCIPLGYDSDANWFITMCEQLNSPFTSATGEHFLFNNETNRTFVARLREWYEKGYVTTQEISGAYTSKLFTMKPEEKGNCYMCISSSAGARHHIPKDRDTGEFMFEVGIAPLPQANPSNPKAVSQGASLCIFNQENDAEELASWLFVKFLTTNVDFQAEFSLATGYMPVLETVVDHPVFQECLAMANGYDGLLMLAMKIAFEQADAFFVAPAFNGCAEARDQVGYLLMRCMTDPAANTVAGIKKAFEDAIKECKYIIGES